MSVYHKKSTQPKENYDWLLQKDELTLLDIKEAVKDRFGSFCTAVGIQALMKLMDRDVEDMAGPKGRHNPNRVAYRHGFQATTVPMGSQRIAITRPRVRSIESDQELPIPSYEVFNNDEQLLEAALNRMLHGLSSRDYRHGIEDYNNIAETSGRSKSTISRRFIKASAKEAQKILGRRFDDESISALMIDGIGFGDHTAIVALGITSEGRKVVLGLRIGSTENAQVCHDLLTDLIDRGLNYQGGLLAIIDGAKALRKALKDVFGPKVLIQRCQVHKLRNVLDYLPKYKRAYVKHKLQRAWASGSAAVRQLRSLATSLESDYPDAAASLREGLEETVTILRLNIPGLLQKTLRSTNPIESAFSLVAKNIKKVKNWKNDKMVQPWAGAALMDAEYRSNRIAGYRSMSVLSSEVQRLTLDESAGVVEKESIIA